MAIAVGQISLLLLLIIWSNWLVSVIPNDGDNVDYPCTTWKKQ